MLLMEIFFRSNNLAPSSIARPVIMHGFFLPWPMIHYVNGPVTMPLHRPMQKGWVFAPPHQTRLLSNFEHRDLVLSVKMQCFQADGQIPGVEVMPVGFKNSP